MLTMPAPKSRSTVLVLARELAAKDMFLAQTADGDLVLGKDGSKWRHGWVPLNAVAASIKAKKWKGHGGEKPKVASVASSRGSAGKSRIDIERTMRGGGPDRGKTRSSTLTGLKSADHVKAESVVKAFNAQNNGYTAHHHVSEPRWNGQIDHSVYITHPSGYKSLHYSPHDNQITRFGGRSGGMAANSHANAIDQLNAAARKHSLRQAAKAETARRTAPEGKTDQQKLDTLARKYGRDNAYRHPNGRQYFVNKQSPFSHPTDPHVGYSLEGQSGEHLGRISVREGKLHIEHAAHGGAGQDLGSVDTPKQAVHGLVAARYLQDQQDQVKRDAEQKAREDAAQARKDAVTEAQKTVEAAKREQDRRAVEREMQKADKNRRDLFSGSGPKPTRTKNDTPRMQATREALSKTLDARATDITKGVHPDTLRHGQVVTFRTPDTYTHKLPPHSEATNVGTVHSGGGYGQHTLFNRHTVKDDHHLYRIEPKHLSGGEGRSLDIHVDQSGDVRGAKLVGYKNGIFAQPEHVDPSELHKMAPELFHPPQSGGSVRYKHVGRQMETTKHPGQTRTGHVVHTGWGQTSVHSMNPETGKSEYFTSHHGGGQRARVGNDFAKSENDPEALVHARKSFQGINRGHTPDTERTSKTGISAMQKQAQAELDKRTLAKKGVTAESLGQRSTADLEKLIADPKGSPAVKALARAVLEKRRRSA